MKYYFRSPSIILAFFLGAVLLGSRLVFGFTEPTATPPLNNVPPPFTPPAGTVIFSTNASCPLGWSRYGAADGRYIVGSPSSIGSQIGSALSNQENRTVGYHTHGVYDPGHSHYYDRMYDSLSFMSRWGWGGDVGFGSTATSYNGTGISIYPAGSVGGTNAPYIQLLICQKN